MSGAVTTAVRWMDEPFQMISWFPGTKSRRCQRKRLAGGSDLPWRSVGRRTENEVADEPLSAYSLFPRTPRGAHPPLPLPLSSPG